MTGDSREGHAVSDRQLFPFQVAGVERLSEADCVLLADEMGLGKTVQAVTALSKLFASNSLSRALVVAPAPAIPQWRAHLYAWAPELSFSTIRGSAAERGWRWRTPANVYIASYEVVRADFSTNPHSPIAGSWDVVILDEAQRIKNRGSVLAVICKRLRRHRAWALTGTPVENQVDDLASILEFTRPYDGATAVRPIVDVEDILAVQSEVQLRRRKADVLDDLPPKISSLIPVELTGPQRSAYQRAEREGTMELLALGPRITITHILELILRLKQICNFEPVTGESAKLTDLSQRMTHVADAGSQALVFSQFVQEPFGVLALSRRLAQFRPLTYTGDSAPIDRETVLRRFKSSADHRLLILSLRAGGVGLNLPEASYVFHFDSWWNPAAKSQAEDRAHRVGQRSTVFAYSYVCVDTVEERIEEILAAKHRLFTSVVDRQIGDTGLSRSELFGLVGLRPQ